MKTILLTMAVWASTAVSCGQGSVKAEASQKKEEVANQNKKALVDSIVQYVDAAKAREIQKRRAFLEKFRAGKVPDGAPLVDSTGAPVGDRGRLSLRERIKKKEESTEKLIKMLVNDLGWFPYLGHRSTLGGILIIHAPTPGQFGMPESLFMVQVVDDSNALAHHGDNDDSVWVSGMSFEGYTDKGPITVPRPCMVTTKRYQSLRGQRTIPHLIVIPEDIMEAVYARVAKREAEAARKVKEEAAEEAAKQAAIEAAKWRTWTTADGKHKVEAKFVKLILGTLTLEKRDGTTVDVKLDILCPEDKKYLEELKRYHR